jgi:plasmid stabilization system protein ParE
MPLDVYLASKALADIEHCRAWWAEHRSAEQAERWHVACEQAMDSLPSRATNCSRARESVNSPVELRQLAFGVGRRPTHRLVFAIRPEKIVLYRVTHLAQEDLSIDEI